MIMRRLRVRRMALLILVALSITGQCLGVDDDGLLWANASATVDDDEESPAVGVMGFDSLTGNDLDYDDDWDLDAETYAGRNASGIIGFGADDPPIVIGAPLPAPITPAAGRHSTRTNTVNSPSTAAPARLFVQKCCPMGQVALASTAGAVSLPSADDNGMTDDLLGAESKFLCVPRSDALDPYWDWLGNVLAISPAVPLAGQFGGDSGAATTTSQFLDPPPPESEAMNVTFGVPTCQHYSVLYPGLFPSQEFFVSVDGYLRKRSRHVQPPLAYCVDRFMLNENVTATVRGAVICGETSWLPPQPQPAVESPSSATVNGGLSPQQQTAHAIPKCCKPNEALAADVGISCFHASTSTNPNSRPAGPFFPITDSTDGRPLLLLTADADEEHRVSTAVVQRDDVLARDFDNGRNCRSPLRRVTAATHDFYLLDTGRLYFPAGGISGSDTPHEVDGADVIGAINADEGRRNITIHHGKASSMLALSVDPGSFCIDTQQRPAEPHDGASGERNNNGIESVSNPSAHGSPGRRNFVALLCHPLQQKPSEEILADADDEAGRASSSDTHRLVVPAELGTADGTSRRGTVEDQWTRYDHECSGTSGSKPVACVPKCCPFGELWGSDAQGVPACVPAPDGQTEWRPGYYHEDGGVFLQVEMAEEPKVVDAVGPLCPEGAPPHAIPQIPADDANQTFYLLTTGQLHSVMYSMQFPSPSYCVDRMVRRTATAIVSDRGHQDQDHDVIHDIALLCAPVPGDGEPPAVRAVFVGFLVASCVFLALTLLLASILPDSCSSSSRLATWTLLSYVASLLVAMVILATLQITLSALPETPCIAVACVMYYCFLAAFLWLNVMSFDIWRTLRGRPVTSTNDHASVPKQAKNKTPSSSPSGRDHQQHPGSAEKGEGCGPFEFDPADAEDAEETTPMKLATIDDDDEDEDEDEDDERAQPAHVVARTSRDRRLAKFAKRCLYAFGIPALMTGLLLVFQYAPAVPPSFLKAPIDPGHRCWLKNDWAVLFYFYGPIAVVLCANLVFFALTVHFLVTHRRTTKNLIRPQRTSQQHRHLSTTNSNNGRLCLFAKLFVVMGVGWIAEVVSWKVKAREYFYLTDAVNALTGIFVFLIFVCRRKTLKDLRKMVAANCWRRRRRGDDNEAIVSSSSQQQNGLSLSSAAGTRTVSSSTAASADSSTAKSKDAGIPRATSNKRLRYDDDDDKEPLHSGFLAAVLFRNKKSKSYSPKKHSTVASNGAGIGTYSSRADSTSAVDVIADDRLLDDPHRVPVKPINPMREH